MMGKKKTPAEAKADFGRHIVCSQQVFAHFADRLGIAEELALRVASCFGSGLGRADVCGCVTGGLMVLGLAHGCGGPCSRAEQQSLYAVRDAFTAAFSRAQGSLLCREILGHDLTIPGQRAVIVEKGLFSSVCAPLVCAACAMLEELLRARPPARAARMMQAGLPR